MGFDLTIKFDEEPDPPKPVLKTEPALEKFKATGVMDREELKVRIITKANEEYLLLGSLPTIPDYCLAYGVSEGEVKKALYELDKAFDSRFGINVRSHYGTAEELKAVPAKERRPKSDTDFPPNFILACNVICQTTDKRSTSAKLKAIGVTNSQWESYLRVKKNRDYFEALLDKTFQGAETNARLSLIRNIEAGDLPSIKHYQEYTGRYRPNAEFTMSLGLIIAKLMEILSAKLSPEDLIEVADQIEQITQAPAELQQAN